jgi:hypothetical protein
MARLLDYLRLLVPQRRARWSIGIYAGASPFALAPHPALDRGLALAPEMLAPAIAASGVADPFLVRHGGAWHMFFEIENRHTGRGEIGLAQSADGVAWRFVQTVLAESFHLSYPLVLEDEGEFFMVPEGAAGGGVRLYRATDFPRAWTFDRELVAGDIADATPFRHDGKWWMIAVEGFGQRDTMVIYCADRLRGPWRPHRGNPLAPGNRRSARPAGRVVRHGGRLVRFAQDDEQQYGRCVRAWVIDALTEESYAEHPCDNERELLGPSGTGWNASGMHHVDAHVTADGSWLASVDGRRTVWVWPVLERIAARMANLGRSGKGVPAP